MEGTMEDLHLHGGHPTIEDILPQEEAARTWTLIAMSGKKKYTVSRGETWMIMLKTEEKELPECK